MRRLPLVLLATAFAGSFHLSLSAQESTGAQTSPVVSATGNGGLTVGVNARGDVVTCLWPTPSYYDQIGYRADGGDPVAESDAYGRGLRWEVVVDGEVVTFGGDTWPTRFGYTRPDSLEALTVATHDEIAVRQHLFVHPDRDILVSRVAVINAPAPPVLTWRADFTPCTRKLPEVPIADSTLDHLNDFAAYVDPAGPYMIHFKPRQAGTPAWRRAEAWANSGSSQHDWSEFGPGTWIAVAGMGDVEGMQVLGTHELAGTASDNVALGDCASSLRLRPAQDGRTYAATVVVGFGETLADAREQIAFAQQRGFDGMVADSDAAARAYLDEANLAQGTDESPADGATRALLTLLICTDRRSGGVVRSPSVQPHLARSWPGEGAWVAHALDVLGLHTRAERLLRFYLKEVREESERGIPRGSLPASLYTDSVPASPHVVIDFEAVSWVLWSLNRHVEYLSKPNRRGLLRDIWSQVEAMGAFLTTWRDARRGAPLDIPDPVYFSDADSRRIVLAAHAAMRAIIALAEEVEDTAPESWRRREEELRRLATEIVSKGDWIQTDEFLPFPMAEDLAPDDLARAIRNRVAGLDHVGSLADAIRLCESTQAALVDANIFTELRPVVRRVVQRDEGLPPDSGVAARLLVAAGQLRTLPD